MSKRKAETQGSRSGSFNGQGTANPMDGRGRATAAQMAARRLKDSKGHRRRTSSPASSGLSFGQQNAQFGGGVFGSNPSDPSQSQPQEQSLPSFDLGQSQQNGVQPNGSSSEQPTTSIFSNTNQQSGSLLFGGNQFSSSGFSFGAPQSVQKNPFSTASTSQPTIEASGYQGKIFSLPAASQITQAAPHAVFPQTVTSNHPFKFAPAASQSTQSRSAQAPQSLFSGVATPNHPFKFTSASSQPAQEQTQPAQVPQVTISNVATPNHPFKFASAENQPAQARPQPAQAPQSIFSKEATPNYPFNFVSTSTLSQTQPAEAPQPAFSENHPFQFTSATSQPTQVLPNSQTQPQKPTTTDQPLQFAPATAQPVQTALPNTSKVATPSGPFKFASATTQPAAPSQSIFSKVATSNHQFNFTSANSQTIGTEVPQPPSGTANPNNHPFFARGQPIETSHAIFSQTEKPSHPFQGFSAMRQPKETSDAVLFQTNNPNYQFQFGNSAISQGSSTNFQSQAHPGGLGQTADATYQPLGVNHSSDKPQLFHGTAAAAGTSSQLTDNTPAPASQGSMPSSFPPNQDAASQSSTKPNIFSDQQAQNQSSSVPTPTGGGFTGFKGIGGGLQLNQLNSETGGPGSSTIFGNLKEAPNATPNAASTEHRMTLLKSSSTPLGEIPLPNSESEAPARNTVFANHFGKDVLHTDPITKGSSNNLFSALGQGNSSVNIPPSTASAQSFSTSHVGNRGAESSKPKLTRKIAHPGKFFTGRSTISSPTKAEQAADSQHSNNYSGIFSTATSAFSQQPSNFLASTSSNTTASVPESNSNIPSTITTQAAPGSGSNNRNSLPTVTTRAATSVDSSSRHSELSHILGPVPNIPPHFSETQKQQYATLYRLRSLNCAFAKEAISLDVNPLADLSPWTEIYRDTREKILELGGSPKKRKSIEDEADDAQNGPDKQGKAESFTSGVVQSIEFGGVTSQSDSKATTGDSGYGQGVKRKANEDVSGDDAGKRARVDGTVNYPALASTGQRRETSQTVSLFSDILKQKDKDVIGNPPIPEAKGASGASAFKSSALDLVTSPEPSLSKSKASTTGAASFTGSNLPTFGTPGNASNPESKGDSAASLFKFPAPTQVMDSVSRLFPSQPSTAGAGSSTDPKLPTFGTLGNPSNTDVKGNSRASLFRFSAPAQTTGSTFRLFPSTTTTVTPTSFGLKLPTLGTSVNFMDQFGKIAEESAKKEKEKRKAEDFDSEDDDEAEWERRDAEEQHAKKQKLTEQIRDKGAKFIPGIGFTLLEGKSEPSKPTPSTGPKLPTFGTPVNFMGQFGKIAEENAKKGKEKRKAEDFDSEDEDEAEWERRDAEEQRVKKQKLVEQIGGKSAKFIPGKGFTFVEKTVPLAPALPIGVIGAPSIKPPTFSAVSTPNSGDLGKSAEDDTRTEEATRSPTASSLEAGADSEKSPETGPAPATNTSAWEREADFSKDSEAETSAKTPSSEPGEQAADSPRGTDPTVSKVASRGGLFDRISKDKDGNPVRILPADGEKPTKPSSASGINFSQSPFGQTWGSSSGSSIFGKSPTSSISGVAPTPSNGTNMFGFKVTPDGDHTWKESSPIKFSTSKAPTFSFTETAPSAGATSEGNSEKSPSKNPFGGDASVDTLPPSPSPSLTVSKPMAGLFGSTPDSPAPSGSSVKSADVGFTFGGPPKSMASLLVPSMATSVNTSRATTPGVTTDTGESANESTAEGEKAEDSKQLDLTTGGPGEEDEDVIFEVRAKAFKYNQESKQYKSHGVGPFRVLKHRETGKSRMLLRSDPNGNVALNAALLKEVKYENKTAKFVSVVTASENGKLTSWQVKVGKNEDAIELARVLEENKLH